MPDRAHVATQTGPEVGVGDADEQVGALARSRGLQQPILWIAIPTAVEMIGRMNESLVVYQVSDKYDANTMDHATDPQTIRRLHERAIDAADIILYSGRKLLSEATRGQERSYLLEQAVDFDHWAKVGSNELEVAGEVARIPQPRIGYFGAIEPWLVDQELIKRASVDALTGTGFSSAISRAA